MFTHCNRKIKPLEIWFLQDNKDFIKRKLYLALCPICKACIVKLYEIRKSDGSLFKRTYYKREAENVTKKMIKQVEYTSSDVKKIKKIPFGLCYGENSEIHNSKGEIIEIRQKRCDFFGVKEIILKVKT
ncbi:MAG: hypothetical protein LUH11_02935 [Candidatus Gastranaerophilales bacterium]|nr:hypothetical protein [Candidatus Gastranaerophilales bacterium]